MILGVSGHRDLGGKIFPNSTYNKVCFASEKLILELKPEKIVSGMATGYDTLICKIALKHNIEFIAAVPFLTQEKQGWTEQEQEEYHELLLKAAQVVIVSPGGYASGKYQIRNEWIVDNSNELLACYDEGGSSGTFNCIKYAESINKKIYKINPLKL